MSGTDIRKCHGSTMICCRGGGGQQHPMEIGPNGWRETLGEGLQFFEQRRGSKKCRGFCVGGPGPAERRMSLTNCVGRDEASTTGLYQFCGGGGGEDGVSVRLQDSVCWQFLLCVLLYQQCGQTRSGPVVRYFYSVRGGRRWLRHKAQICGVDSHSRYRQIAVLFYRPSPRWMGFSRILRAT